MEKEKMKEIREKHSLSTEEFGALIYMTSRMVAYMEKGEKPISESTESHILDLDKAYSADPVSDLKNKVAGIKIGSQGNITRMENNG